VVPQDRQRQAEGRPGADFMKLREIPSKTLRVFNGTESHILNFI
jgi:hypothetical protein